MEDKKVLKEVRNAVESAGGYIEVIHNLKEPDMWGLPGRRKYHAIGSIHLENCQIDRTIFEVISKLNKVESVFLHDSRFDEDDLKYLESVDMKLLDLGNVNLSNSGLAYVGKIISVEDIWLNENIFTDEGLDYLCDLSNLKALTLSKNSISSHGILKLNSVLYGLNYLRLNKTDFCDIALAEMAKRTVEFYELGISGTKVSNEGGKNSI